MAEVETASGVVDGIAPGDAGGVHAFLGIPYAEPPLGPHRLGPPVPVAAWDGARPCVAYGATAPQPDQGFTIIPEPIVPGDNCLNLNVFTPELGAEPRLPVFVWIHGGGFTNGGNASAWYHGRGFGPDGVVVVAVNYRLGIEGFLPLRGAPANRALLDLMLALEWVQENVAAFGGDPGNVTIGGQSAGGAMCATLLVTPRAAGLFRRSVLMSGAANHVRRVEDAQRLSDRIASAIGVPASRDALMAFDTDELVAAQKALGPFGGSGGDGDVPSRFARVAKGGLAFGPVIDGDLVPEPPLDALRAGASRDVDLLVGTVAEEVDALAGFASDLADDQLVAALEAAGLSSTDAAGYRELHADEPANRVLGKAMTEVMFRTPAVRVAEARRGERTFAYEFRWPSPTGFGVVHCLDIPFAFDVLDADKVDVVAGDDPPRSLAADVHGAWVDFICTGDPGWAPYDLETRPVMTFDAPRSRVLDDPHAATRERFAGLS
jgi:para-nitrobenzyl esterase